MKQCPTSSEKLDKLLPGEGAQDFIIAFFFNTYCLKSLNLSPRKARQLMQVKYIHSALHKQLRCHHNHLPR